MAASIASIGFADAEGVDEPFEEAAELDEVEAELETGFEVRDDAADDAPRDDAPRDDDARLEDARGASGSVSAVLSSSFPDGPAWARLPVMGRASPDVWLITRTGVVRPGT
jgi:hypothetical protein